MAEPISFPGAVNAQNPQSSQYFNSLPPMVQETIMQTGVKFTNEDDLKKYAENLMRHN